MQQSLGLCPSPKNGTSFVTGCRHGIPICLGYFAVSFALGIAARNTGLNALQAFFMSLGMVASAGEFAALTLIGGGEGVLELVFTTLIVNLRYFLMSCSLTQKISPKTAFFHRFPVSYCITDEIFGLSVSVPEFLNPFYTYGITFVSVSGWCAGTVLGVLAGSILPALVTECLGVAMYGMFISIVIPPGKKNRFLLGLVAVSMGASGLFAILPVIKEISAGFRIIILTLVIASAAALLRPVDALNNEKEEHV